MKFTFDIDGVLCENGSYENYANAIPRVDVINKINDLHKAGQKITLHTSRLKEDRQVTKKWLKKHKVSYDVLITGKPQADVYFDDKALPVDLIFKTKTNLNRKKLGICMSGGMDSYIAYHYAIKELGYSPEDIVCINFDINHPYKEKEKVALDSFNIPYKTINVGLISKENGNVPDIKNYVISGRNMIFASIMANFAQEIWITGMKFENHYLMFDKNEPFFRLATIALTQALGEYTVVKSPFMNMTKTESIKWALDNGITKEELGLSTSCYHPTKKRCGECSLCFKRNVAMLKNGIQEDYETNPFESEEGKALIKKYQKALENNDFSHYQKERILETLDLIK